MRNIWTIVPDSQDITIKQNVRLPGRMPPEKFQLNEIQNGRLVTIIDFKVPNIWEHDQF